MSVLVSRAVLLTETEFRASQFDELRKSGIIIGEYDDNYWIYRGERLNFNARLKEGRSHTSLTSTSASIARNLAISCIVKEDAASTIKGKLEATKILDSEIGDSVEAWATLSGRTLDRCVTRLAKLYTEGTAYNRASGLSQVVAYLNQVSHRCDEHYCQFLWKRINWKTKLRNPIVSTLDRIGRAGQEHTASHYDPDLHVALGRVRSSIRANPSLEPSPGYDLIRLEALAFAMALGIRVWEVCSLPANAYDVEPGNNVPFVRVIAEKGAMPAARPIDRIWAPLISEAHQYLLEACAEARCRARDIEQNGFAFLVRGLSSYRKKHPLTQIDRDRLALSGLDESVHFFVEEVVRTFDVSENELSTTGRGLIATTKVISASDARLIRWIDQRMSRRDWHLHARRAVHGKSQGLNTFTSFRLADLTGISKAKLLRTEHGQDVLDLIGQMQHAGIFNGRPSEGDERWLAFVKLWEVLREKILSKRYDRVVNVTTWSAQLQVRYERLLSAHFRENCSVGEKGRRGVAGGKLSDKLVVLWEQQFSHSKSMGVLPRPMLRHDLYNYLCGDTLKQTVFKRLDVRTDSGSHVAISPHDIRHWVTTAKLRAGASQMMVDLWMGRKPGQSRRYDHRTPSERAEEIRAIYCSESVPHDFLGRKVISWRERGLSEQEVARLITEKFRVAHFVPWGMCSRELYISPCDRGLMCLRGYGTEAACKSFHVDKADQNARSSIEELLGRYLTMLRQLEPNYEKLQLQLVEELNDAAPLDQHLRFILDVVQGCQAALGEYDATSTG